MEVKVRGVGNEILCTTQKIILVATYNSQVYVMRHEETTNYQPYTIIHNSHLKVHVGQLLGGYEFLKIIM